MMLEAGEAWDWTEVAGRLADEQVILRHKNMWNTPEDNFELTSRSGLVVCQQRR